MLGRLCARLGDHDRALAYAEEIERLQMPSYPPGSLNIDLAQPIRAPVLGDRGRPTEALAALEQMPEQVIPFFDVSPFFDDHLTRYLRGGLLVQLGRDEEALPWFAELAQWGGPTPLRAPAHLSIAEIYERLGDEVNAVLHYRKSLELWRDCDPELQPMVTAVEGTISRLARERTNSQ